MEYRTYNHSLPLQPGWVVRVSGVCRKCSGEMELRSVQGSGLLLRCVRCGETATDRAANAFDVGKTVVKQIASEL